MDISNHIISESLGKTKIGSKEKLKELMNARGFLISISNARLHFPLSLLSMQYRYNDRSVCEKPKVMEFMDFY